MTSLTTLCWYLRTSTSKAPRSPCCTRWTRLKSLASAVIPYTVLSPTGPIASPCLDRPARLRKVHAPPPPDPGRSGPRSRAGGRRFPDPAAPAGLRRRPAGLPQRPHTVPGHNASATDPVPSCRGGTATAAGAGGPPALQHPEPRRSVLPLQHFLFDFGDRARRIEILRAHVRTIHNGVAAIKLEGVVELIEALTGGLIAAVDDPAVGGQQGGRPEETVTVPPVAGAGGRTAGTQNARRGTIDEDLFLLGLQPLAIRRRWRSRFQPRLNRGVLRVEVRQVRHQVLHHRHVRQRVDLDL